MKILLDTNIILNFLTGREDTYSHECVSIMEMCAEHVVEGYVSLHSLSIIWYVLRKHPAETRLNWIKFICEVLTLAGADNEIVLKALENSDFKDFEDNLQDCCAQAVGADYLVTANLRHCSGRSRVPALSPAHFLKRLEQK